MTDDPKPLPAACPCCNGQLTPHEAVAYGRCEDCYVGGLKLPNRGHRPPHYDQAPGGKG